VLVAAGFRSTVGHESVIANGSCGSGATHVFSNCSLRVRLSVGKPACCVAKSSPMATTAIDQSPKSSGYSRLRNLSAFGRPCLDVIRPCRLISLLYGWEQAAGNDDAKNWVRANTQSDDDLLAILARSRGCTSGSYGIQYPLKRQDIGHFLDYDAARQRVRDFAERPDANANHRRIAAELLEAFAQGDRD